MPQLTTAHLLELLRPQEAPCISLYQPTHRKHPENQQDVIRFKNLTKAVEESLRQKYPNRDVRGLLEPFHDLAGKAEFWNHARDGLAVLASPSHMNIFAVQRTMPELAVVADSFHVKPLLRHLQSADHFHVLAVSRDRARVYAGDRYVLDEESLDASFPTRQDQVITPPSSEPGVAVASSSGGVGSPKMMRGMGSDKTDSDTEKFFRAVDRAMIEHFSKPTGWPVVVACLTEHIGMFRGISHNPNLVPDHVAGNPEALSTDELRKQVWKVLEPHYLARLEKLKENFGTAAARQQGSGDLSDVARAAVAGRVGTLLVESEKVLPGQLDRNTGAIQSGDLKSPHVEDMLDDLAEMVLLKGGEVVVVPSDRMPTKTGLAATYRF
jgi:hypothetical protein